jgi:hypothetical protein
MAIIVAAILAVVAALQHADTGVKGIVTIGPTCPVERPGDPNCRDKPYRAAMKLVRARGHTLVKTFTPGSDGRFTVHVAAGRYVLEKAVPSRLPSLRPVTVTVRRHQFTRVAIQFDSGIR